MIDLTPLDVRKKKDDLRKVMRGYDPSEVDTFLQMVADRLEEVVRENLALQERNHFLEERVESSAGREKAVQEALVSAQALRQEVKEQAKRESELIRKEAEMDLRRALDDAEERLRVEREQLRELIRHRSRFLHGFRSLLERELDLVADEEGRDPMEDLPQGIREALEAREEPRRASGGGTPARDGGGSGPDGTVSVEAGDGDQDSAHPDQSKDAAAPDGTPDWMDGSEAPERPG